MVITIVFSTGPLLKHNVEIAQMVERVPSKRQVLSLNLGLGDFSLIEKNNFHDESCTRFEQPY